MTSTSSEGPAVPTPIGAPVVLRGAAEVTDAPQPGDLRTGTWTRLGGTGVLGDRVTEGVLARIADQARAAGHAQGYAAGWAEGRRRAAEQAAATAAELAAEAAAQRSALAAERDALVTALATAAEEARRTVQQQYDELAGHALDLALDLAAAVLDREVAVAADPGREALHRALREVEVTVPVTVQLHPDDAAALDPDASAGRPLTVVPDASLDRGDAVATTADGVVDATLRGALARVREVLGR